MAICARYEDGEQKKSREQCLARALLEPSRRCVMPDIKLDHCSAFGSCRVSQLVDRGMLSMLDREEGIMKGEIKRLESSSTMSWTFYVSIQYQLVLVLRHIGTSQVHSRPLHVSLNVAVDSVLTHTHHRQEFPL